MKKSRTKSCAVNVGRWMSYAAAGAVTAMAASNEAEATIYYSGVINFKIFKATTNPISFGGSHAYFTFLTQPAKASTATSTGASTN